MSGDISAVAHDPWLELRAKWEEHEEKMAQAAINDPMVQTLAGLLPYCTRLLTPAKLIDQLGEYISKNYYDLPADRHSEVFMAAADIFIEREMRANGEA